MKPSRRLIPRCPICRSLPGEYREIWNGHGLSFDVDENGKPDDEGYTFEGSPVRVLASCKCGHCWTIRGVTQITEVRALFEVREKNV